MVSFGLILPAAICTSWILDFGAQHCVPDFLHLNKSVISAFRKHVKLSNPTMHEPGHSSLGSGAAVVVGACVVVVGGGGGGRFGGGLVTGAFVLSQQIDPRLQFAVCGMISDGRSQNAAIMLSIQNPGHLRNGG